MQKSHHPDERRVAIGERALLWPGPFVLAVAMAIAYYLAARLSLALLTKPDGVAVFWPAAGIAAGILISFGRGVRLPVVAGVIAATIIANMLVDRGLWVSLAKALCNAGEALLTGWLIESYFGPGFALDSVRRVLGLLVAAAIAAAVSGVGGTLAFKFLQGSTAPVTTTWYHWFASDGLGIITVAPLVIGLASAMRDPPPRAELIEGAVALGVLAAMSAFVISLPAEPWATAVPAAAIFPLLLWLAARCRPVFAAGGSFIIAVAVVWTTTFGVGLFGNNMLPIGDRIFAAQASMIGAALCASVLAALFAHQRKSEAALNDSMERLQQALRAGAVMAFEWDAQTRLSHRSENAAQILGFTAQQSESSGHFLARVHPRDRARFKASLKGVRPESPSYAVSFRYLRPDGQEVWLEETAEGEFDSAGRCLRIKGLTRDISLRKRAEEHQGLLMTELDHRVKNVLARVAAVLAQTREGNTSLDEFVKVVDGRIKSMANAHALLTRCRWQGVGIVDLVRQALAPHAMARNTTICGPNVALSAAAAESTAMVLHELATNAAKYGALSRAEGHVLVTWERISRGNASTSLRISWQESGGPSVAVPTRRGYGTSLIQNSHSL